MMLEENEKRIIFRPTEKQLKRIDTVFKKTGRYRTLSEMYRHIFEIGLDKLEE